MGSSARRLALATTAFWLLAAGAARPADEARIELAYETTTLLSSPGYGPDLALGPGGAVFVSWEESGGGVSFSGSMDDGLTFSPSRVLLANGDGFAYSQQSIAAGATGEVHLVAAEFDVWRTGLPEVLYLRSVDGGASFTQPVYLSTLDLVNSYSPTIVAGWTVAAAWEDLGHVVYRQSSDRGLTFSAPRILSDPMVQSLAPSIALAGPQNVYVAWYHTAGEFGGIEGVTFTRSLDGGATFSPPATLIAQPIKGWWPLLGVDGGGTVHLVWGQGNAWVDMKVFYMRSTDEGATWSTPLLLSAAAENSILAGFTVAPDGGLFVSWRHSPTPHIYPCRAITTSTDGGLSFSRPAPGPGCDALGARSSSQLQVAFAAGPATAAEVFHSRVTVKSADSLHGFHTVAPCRLADTRLTGDPVAAGRVRVLDVAGRCGIPPEAEAVAVNVTVAQPSHNGHLALYPAGTPLPATSTLNFVAGITRANSAVVAVGAGGAIAVKNGMVKGSSHIVLDVTGYFR